jgi:TolC family type I secretion outer membrane protein
MKEADMGNDLSKPMMGNWGATIILIVGGFLSGCAGLPVLSKTDKTKIETYMQRSMVRAEAPSQTLSVSPQSQSPVSGKHQEKPLTLDTCVQIALDKNPAVRAAREGVAAAKEGVGEARAPYYPEVGFSAGYSRWQKHAFLPSGVVRQGISSVIGPTNDWSTGLKARYTLFDSGERQAKLRAALAGKRVAEEDAARIRQDIALDVYQSYYSLVSALENRSISTDQLARAEDHLRLARERKAAGVVPRADVVRAQVEVGDAKLTLVKAENLVRISRGNLNTSMGLPVETPIEVEARSEEKTSPDEIDLFKAFDQAVHSRPELTVSLQRVESARSAVDRAKSEYGPKLRGEGGYGWRDTDFFPQDQDWLVGLTIDLPVFTGFATKHRLAKTKAELLREEAQVERAVQNVRQEVWSAHSKLKETYEAIQAVEVQVQDARESMRLAGERYKVGAGTITDLMDAQTALARAEANLVGAQWDYQISRAAFRRAIGDLGAGRNYKSPR